MPFTVPRLLVGSSPLTRGTPYLDVAEVACGGLIPARAGNILRAAAKLSRARAHPRSRGEHQGIAARPAVAPGSSPLARGTSLGFIPRKIGDGLIPARAGNIIRVSARGGPLRAHPRSRGEHPALRRQWCPVRGSSPLARGTQGDTTYDGAIEGLIPARAGNTPNGAIWRYYPRAHPRSRGEHNRKLANIRHVTGSSPLARGTPVTCRPCGLCWGLIPARAGNTH